MPYWLASTSKAWTKAGPLSVTSSETAPQWQRMSLKIKDAIADVFSDCSMHHSGYSRTSHNAWLLSSAQVGRHAPCILHNAWCFDTKFVWYAVWGIQGPSIYGPCVSKHCQIVAKATWLSMKIITSCFLVLLFLMPPECSSHRLEVKCKPCLSHTPYKPLPMSSMHWQWNGARWQRLKTRNQLRMRNLK